MTGDLVKAIKNCPQPVIAAIDGICVGAGAILAMASESGLAPRSAKISFIFSKLVWLAVTWELVPFFRELLARAEPRSFCILDDQ